MIKTPRQTRKLSPFFLFPFTLLLTLLLFLPWVNAKEAPKPKPQPWQIDGIVAAIDDSYDEVKVYAFGKLAEYKSQDLKSVLKKSEDIARKAAEILKDKKEDVTARVSAARALGNLGEAAKPYLKDLLDILKDEQDYTDPRISAAQALGNLGQAAQPYVKDLADILKDDKVHPNARVSAAQALGNLGEAAKPYVKDLLDILKDEQDYPYLRVSAAQALGKLEEAAKPYVTYLADILRDEKVNAYLRGDAAQALCNLGEAAKPYVKDILDFLKNKEVPSDVRVSAAQALGNLGEAAKPYVKDILDFLKNDQVSSDVRVNAAQALGNLGEAAQPYVKDLADILKNDEVDVYVRGSAAEALGNLGEVATPYLKDFLDFLKNEHGSQVRGGVAVALGNLGEAAKPYVKDILYFLKNEKVYAELRRRAAEALGNIRQLELNEVVVVLDRVYEPNQQNVNFENWRFLTYFLGGGTDEVKMLLKWLGNPAPKSIPAQLKYKEANKTLEVFRDAWAASQGLERLQNDLAEKIADVARMVSWKPQDIPLLQTHYDNLKKGGYNQADTVNSAINDVAVWKWFATTRNTILIHAAFWLALIFAYPKFPKSKPSSSGTRGYAKFSVSATSAFSSPGFRTCAANCLNPSSLPFKQTPD